MDVPPKTQQEEFHGVIIKRTKQGKKTLKIQQQRKANRAAVTDFSVGKSRPTTTIEAPKKMRRSKPRSEAILIESNNFHGSS